MPVVLSVEDGPHPGVSRPLLLRRARAMLAAVQSADKEWSILLTGDDQIQNLNRLYRKKNRPTDVLAFSQLEGEHDAQAGRLLGDVIVSVPTARRQAAAARRDLAAEITMLLAHGLLHLLGWDHVTVAEDRRMRRETQRLCAAAGAIEAPRKRAR
jgi:probable rRNA maturation factor